jgi:hypothetical protein
VGLAVYRSVTFVRLAEQMSYSSSGRERDGRGGTSRGTPNPSFVPAFSTSASAALHSSRGISSAPMSSAQHPPPPLSSHPLPHRNNKSAKITHGVNLNKLKGWSKKETQSQLANEEARQELALMKMKAIVISNSMVVRLQCWWRMSRCRIQYLQERKVKYYSLFVYFKGWYTAVKAEISYRVSHPLPRPLSLPGASVISYSLSLSLSPGYHVKEAFPRVVE